MFLLNIRLTLLLRIKLTLLFNSKLTLLLNSKLRLLLISRLRLLLNRDLRLLFYKDIFKLRIRYLFLNYKSYKIFEIIFNILSLKVLIFFKKLFNISYKRYINRKL